MSCNVYCNVPVIFLYMAAGLFESQRVALSLIAAISLSASPPEINHWMCSVAKTIPMRSPLATILHGGG